MSEDYIESAYKKNLVSFLGRDFYIDKRVHVPRTKTEPLVELALDHIMTSGTEVVCADVGTGAGVIAISLVLGNELVKYVHATDTETGSVEVSRRNVSDYLLRERISVSQGSLLEPLKGIGLDLIVANVPHASKRVYRNRPYLAGEPKNSTLSGETGLELIEPLLEQAGSGFPELSALFLKIPVQKAEEVVSLAGTYLPQFTPHLKNDVDGNPLYLILKKDK